MNTPQTVFVTLELAVPTSSSGHHHGGCGSIGLDLMAPLAILWFLRRRSSKRRDVRNRQDR
jgi:hypothetical protein